MTQEDLKSLREELKMVERYVDLERRFQEAGGIDLPDDVFGIYCDEFNRRGWSLPQ